MPSHSEILARYGISPKKALGQNFLVNDAILDAIADVEDVSGKHVVEVGPGYGALTEKLLERRPASLTLVEYDPDMVRVLEDRRKTGSLVVPEGVGFSIRHEDVLKFSPERPSTVVANIPYYITSPILFRFLYEVECRPEAMVILMQREVADKVRATKAYGNSYLSLAVEQACDVREERLRVAAENFVPPPKVESAVLRLAVRPQFDAAVAKAMLRVLSAAFSHPRKKASTNLAGGLGLAKEDVERMFVGLGIRPDVRAEAVGLEAWQKIRLAVDGLSDQR